MKFAKTNRAAFDSEYFRKLKNDIIRKPQYLKLKTEKNIIFEHSKMKKVENVEKNKKSREMLSFIEKV